MNLNRACILHSKSLFYYYNLYKTVNSAQKLFTHVDFPKRMIASLYTSRTANKKSTKQLRQECQAIFRLLDRSKISAPSLVCGLQHRSLHTSSCNFNENANGGNQQDKKKDDKKDEAKSNQLLLTTATIVILTATICLMLVSLLHPNSNMPDRLRYVSWNEFLHQMLAKGEVEEVVVRPELGLVIISVYDDAVIKGRLSHYKTFHMNIVDVEKFEEKLRQAEKNLGISPEHRVPVVYERNQDITRLLALLAAVAVMIFLMSRTQIKSSISMDNIFPQLRKAKFTVVDPLTGDGKGVLFKDVAGLKEAKQEIMEFVDYLKRPDKYKALGAKVPKGVLLLGPPGCGKTMLAKAVATESNVPFLAMAGSEFIEMIGGLGAARVRDLFKEARKRSPCIIYVDEIDAIGKKRSMGAQGAATGEEEQTLNQLLVEMDGMATREGVIMLASTNRPDVLDKALLRPGRFDRHVMIDLPTLQERKEIFEQHLACIKLEHKPSYYSFRLAQLTPGFSGADIANVCNESALHGARNKQPKVTSENLEYAVERVVGGTEKRTQVMSMAEKRVVAFHECGHAVVGWMLQHTDALMKVSIVPRTTNVLGFAQYLPTENKLYSTEQLFEKMCMALGGRVAESLVFNCVTTGAEDDLKRVTKMAYAQIRQYGMNPIVGPLSFPSDEESSGTGVVGKKPFSKKLAFTMDQQVTLLIGQAYKKTESILLANMNKLQLLAETLLKKEVLNYNDIEELIGPSPYGKKNLIEAVDWGPEPDVAKPQETPPSKASEP